MWRLLLQHGQLEEKDSRFLSCSVLFATLLTTGFLLGAQQHDLTRNWCRLVQVAPAAAEWPAGGQEQQVTDLLCLKPPKHAGLRVWRLLLQHGQLEDKDIVTRAMMAPKEARTLLYTLLKAGVLQLQVCLLSLTGIVIS